MNTKYDIGDKVWIPVIYNKRNETYIVVDIYNDKDNQKIKLVEARSFNIDKIEITDKQKKYIHSHYPLFENQYAFSKSDRNRTGSWGLNNGFEDIVFTENIMFETEKVAKKEIGKVMCKIIGAELCCCCCKCCNK